MKKREIYFLACFCLGVYAQTFCGQSPQQEYKVSYERILRDMQKLEEGIMFHRMIVDKKFSSDCLQACTEQKKYRNEHFKQSNRQSQLRGKQSMMDTKRNVGPKNSRIR